MEANLYDQPAQARFLNTYVPINFGELYRIGSAQKEAVDQAQRELSANLHKWSEFQSPSAVDTARYYDLTIGKLSPMIEEMASNPDMIKTAEGRSKLQSMINSVDYATLANLKQSSENLAQRSKIIAQLKAQGKYNDQWDDIDISNWDTSTAGIMNDLAPVEYMTANQLSNPYFDNLRPGMLGSKFVDGVKYNITGNNYQDLLSVAKAHYNDLIKTPQGRKYYEQFLKQNNGDEEKATEQFTDMIAQSQIDRTIRPNMTVDPVWLQMAKLSNRGQNQEIVKPQPTRLDFINDSVYRASSSKIGSRFGGYKEYMASLIEKYPNTKIAKDAEKGLKNIENLQKQYQDYGQASQLFMQRYNQTGDDNDYIQALIADSKSKQAQDKLIGLSSKSVLKTEFERRAGFNPAISTDNERFSTKGYLAGVNSALDMIKTTTALKDNDPLLQGIGGTQFEIQEENGTKSKVYQFDNSSGFLLPETVFQIMTDTKPRETKRKAGIFSSSKFPLRELIESGQLNSIQFKPDQNGNTLKMGQNVLLTGKIRIPRSEIENFIGTGLLPSSLANAAGKPIPNNPFMWASQSIKSTIKDLFGGRKVTETVGENGVDYYEIDASKIIPSDKIAPEYWQNVNQEWQGSRGIGGSSQAKETYMDSAEQLLGQ